MEEEGFLLALAANPADLLTHLVYADWLDEQNDPSGLCLRHWVELASTPYSEAAFPVQRQHLERYRLALLDADQEWVEVVERARPWVSEVVAELSARLYLRMIQGRKIDRQWLGSPYRHSDGEWHVPYWPNDPGPLIQRKRSAWSKRRTLVVSPVTAEVSERPEYRGRPALTTG